MKCEWMGSGVLLPAMMAALLLGGCAILPAPEALTPSEPQPEPPPQIQTAPPALPVVTSAADDVMELLDRIGRASPGELAREYDALSAIPEPDRAGGSMVRLALLLSQPGLPFRDDAAALRVLQEWEKRQPEADLALKSFVRWLRGMLTERNRLAGNLEEAGARARDEKKRAEACKDKLEAIKDMEKSLLERDKR
mgnify:CR=1 FL=1